jgi:hypothetical protein
LQIAFHWNHIKKILYEASNIPLAINEPVEINKCPSSCESNVRYFKRTKECFESININWIKENKLLV